MKKKYLAEKLLLSLLSIYFLFGCNLMRDPDEDLIVTGLKPIYGVDGSMSTIYVTDTMAILEPGRIVYRHPYLFVNEINKGIHVIDNSDPSFPQKEAFIVIPFNRDLAVKGNLIYADNQNDLIAIHYISKDKIDVVHREKNVFDGVYNLPLNYSGYFECIDADRGDVIGWETGELINPKCRI